MNPKDIKHNDMMLRHIIKLFKTSDKEKLLTAATIQRHTTYRGKKIRMAVVNYEFM